MQRMQSQRLRHAYFSSIFILQLATTYFLPPRTQCFYMHMLIDTRIFLEEDDCDKIKVYKRPRHGLGG